MGFIGEIQKDILTSSTKLSAILRKAKVLAYKLGNAEFKDWVERELAGYGESIEVPEYRRVDTQSLGNFVGPNGSTMHNQPIHTYNFPGDIAEFASTHVFCDGVRALESLVESRSNSFDVRWPPNITAAIAGDLFPGWVCMVAWKLISIGQIEHILDTVRNRLLTFLLELEQIKPAIETSLTGEAVSIPDQVIEQVFNTYILGGQNIVSSGRLSLEGEVDMGDTFNMSGDFRGAILNIKSTLNGVSQSIGAIPNADDSAKDELKKLVDQLNEALQKVPQDKVEEAEAVAESAKILVEQASAERPNRPMIKITGEGLKAAAQNLAAVMPIVTTIAVQIVAAVMKSVG